ncbi:amidase, partial [Microbispora sp. GKU 823]|uniref:amidase family protein n=1 Tax=Microbispora sp. GKU 823 TaxID=1652100 RepID=UPI0009C5C990
MNGPPPLPEGTVARLAAAVRAGQAPPSGPARDALARIAELDPELHAFTQVFTDAVPVSPTGPLAGVPVAVKDNIDVEGRVTGLGRPVDERSAAARDAGAVALLRAAGAVVVGKTNLPEFASSAVTVNAHYGDARNPRDPRRTAGGSSGGSAAAVAAGMVPAALGTDTGGSVLIPAALTGVCGFRPTYGRVGTGGVIPLSPSLDTVGVIAPGPADVRELMRVLLGPWPGQDGAVRLPGLRVGVLGGEFGEAEGGVRECVEAALDLLRAAGSATRPVELPSAPRARRHARVLYAAEAAGVLGGLLDPAARTRRTVEARRSSP